MSLILKKQLNKQAGEKHFRECVKKINTANREILFLKKCITNGKKKPKSMFSFIRPDVVIYTQEGDQWKVSFANDD